ncbi:RNHCP domain-containing protein [Patescibacteria group bacterium]|nr:RNHCP domain-containing protein [Patescibacteria group bacterium]
MKGKRFTRTIEDFTCQVCQTEVRGTGYTDHCPSCLWSKHVDLFPGDREATCGGLMEPTGVTQKRGGWRILYRCQKCGHKRFNNAGPNDDYQKIIKLSTQPARTPGKPKKGKGKRKNLSFEPCLCVPVF